jgi:hypothetical protein
MAKLDVSDRLVRALLDEVVPLVEESTKWDIQAKTLCYRVLPKKRGYEEIVLGRIKGAGILVDENHRKTIIERLIEYIFESNVAGAYQPASGEILIIRENVDDSNLDGLKLILAHELVHRGQHVNFPHIFDNLDVTIRNIFQLINQEASNLGEIIRMLEKVRPSMTLIESHAHYIQNLLKQLYYPEARLETHFNMASLLMRFLGKKKISQYTEGVPQIISAVKSESVDSLYSRL